ncbi:unnamed protein product [Chrysodeixis includens]|uniref:Uncharacterized protein n=1 Tax=Chrysodeixis includens TaxID=689277 RepID=A0A9P0FWP9_CHRIL|nr:unnamed protein product [Chrysodeixis includens]
MELQSFLVEQFRGWQPPAPAVLARTKRSVTLDWSQVEPFHFVADQLLYRLEKNDKIPPWFVVYRGGKTRKEIDNLAPRHPHKFRLRVIVKATAVSTLADRAIQYYGDEQTAYDTVRAATAREKSESCEVKDNVTSKTDLLTGRDITFVITDENNEQVIEKDSEDTEQTDTKMTRQASLKTTEHKWLESQWSETAWASTDTDGTSVVCFCMAVRCGYMKQVQGMLEERPELIGLINTSNGFTPLATAVRKGDINTVRYLVCAGAELNQPSATGQSALHLAVLSARIPIAQLLLDQGADFHARDLNGLRVEHYAVDSCDIDTLRFILDRGGDVHAEDNNGWTPLFRALCQGAKTEVIEELVSRGSAVETADRAGLPLTSVARLLADKQGRNRDSVLRLVDSSYPHEKALANFTRLTKKIYNVHSLLKLPTLHNKDNLKK